LHDEINKHEGGLDTFSRGYEKFGFIRRYCAMVALELNISHVYIHITLFHKLLMSLLR